MSNGTTPTHQLAKPSYVEAARGTQQPTVIPALISQESEAMAYTARSFNERLTRVETQLTGITQALNKILQSLNVLTHPPMVLVAT